MEMFQTLTPEHTSKTRFADDLVDNIGACYNRHIDTKSGGGRLTPSSREGSIRAALKGLTKSNWGSRTPRSIVFNRQLTAYIYAFWTLRVFEGPIGKSIVLFPGIFNPPPVPTNLHGHAAYYTDLLTDALVSHIFTMSGITYTYFPAAIVPWSGADLMSFDGGAGAIVSAMTDALSANLNNKIDAGYLNPEDKSQIIDGFSSNMNTVLGPLGELNQSLPVFGKSNLL